MRWRGRTRQVWLDPFSDRVHGRDGFAFDVEYHVAVRRTDAGSSCEHRSACAVVRSIVEPALAGCDVLRPRAAEQDINGHLSRLLPRGDAGVVVTGARVAVRADRETAELARRLATERQRMKVQAIEQDRLRARMTFLEREVVRDAATVRLYLLAEQIEQGREVLGAGLEDLESVAEKVRQWSSANKWVVTAEILHDHFDSLPPRAVQALISTLRDSIRDHENSDLLKRFDEVHRPQA